MTIHNEPVFQFTVGSGDTSGWYPSRTGVLFVDQLSDTFGCKVVRKLLKVEKKETPN